MASYLYDVTGISDIPDRMTTLSDRISIDPAISAPFIDITYSVPNISINFSSSASDAELDLIGTMFDVTFHDMRCGQDFMFDNLVENPRRLYNINTVPTNQYDINSCFNVGSSVYNNTTATIYTCVDASSDNAVWLSNPAVGPTGSTGPTGLGFTGPTGTSGPTGSTGPCCPGATGPTGVEEQLAPWVRLVLWV